MPKRSVATTFKAGRRITLLGVTYQVGDVIPKATVRGLKRLSALLSSRRIVASTNHYGKAQGTTGKVQTAPMAYSTKERAKIT